jgi:hypothetical protein
MVLVKNGATVIKGLDTDSANTPVMVYGDLYECPACGSSIVTNFGVPDRFLSDNDLRIYYSRRAADPKQYVIKIYSRVEDIPAKDLVILKLTRLQIIDALEGIKDPGVDVEDIIKDVDKLGETLKVIKGLQAKYVEGN